MSEYCTNHPQIPTKRKCYNCQVSICPDCQILIKHHYFCNIKCYKKYYGLNLVNSISIWLKRPLELPIFLFRDLKKIIKVIKWSFVFNLFLLTAVVFAILLSIKLNNRIHYLENRINFALKDSSDVKTKSTAFPENHFSIKKPINGGMVLSNRIDIEGEADNNQIVSLEVDGEIKAVTLPENGKFKLVNIPATRGNNVFIVKAISKSGEVNSLETLKIDYNNPTIKYLSKNLTRGNTLVPKVALTFDGGYLDNACDEILDTLKEKKIKSTFFLTGYFIRKYAAIVRRMVEDGHEIGNHTWSHPHLTNFVENRKHLTKPTVNYEFIQNQLIKTAVAFQACTGKTLKPYWRAPFGEHNLELREWAAEIGYRHIGWTLGPNWENSMDTMDWVADTTLPTYRTADEILDKILNFGNGSSTGANGSIIIMHLGTLRKNDFPHKKLPDIIDGLRDKGYELVPVSEMFNK